MEKTFKLNGTEYRAVKAKTNDKICKDCHYFLDNGYCDLDVCPAESLGEDLILERIGKSGDILSREEITGRLKSELSAEQITRRAAANGERPFGYVIDYIKDMYGLSKEKAWDIAKDICVHFGVQEFGDTDLAEAVSARMAAEKAIEEENAGHLRRIKELNRKLEEAREKERILLGGLNADLIRKGKWIVEIKGNPFAVTDGSPRPIAEAAVKDILDGCGWLNQGYFGNKRYEGFYQRADCRYGYCPVHGRIVDRIGLTREALEIRGKRELTQKEKEAAIYYIMNYPKTKQQ